MKNIEVEFTSQGVLKKHKAEIREEKTGFGVYEYIYIDKSLEVPQRELLRIANEKGMAVFYKEYKIFPEGKTLMDLIKKR